MRGLAFIIGCLILLAPAAALATGQPKVTVGPPGGATVTLTITWEPDAGATSYLVDGGYDDGKGPFSLTTIPPSAVANIIAHPSGQSAKGWVCVTATVAAKPLTPACNSYVVPGASSTIIMTYQEPTTRSDGTPLTDLASVKMYYAVSGGPEQSLTFPASSPTGGGKGQQNLTLPMTQGTFVGQSTAVTKAGLESQRSPASAIVLSGTPPGSTTKPMPAGRGSLTITP